MQRNVRQFMRNAWVPLVLLAAACNVGSPGSRQRTQTAPVGARGDGDSYLQRVGFHLTPAEADVPVGALTASFDAPAVNQQSTADFTPGTALVTTAGAPVEHVSVVVLDAEPGTDLVYAVLQDALEPNRYLVLAARGPDLVADASLALDGTQASLLSLDETAGNATISLNGTLHVTTADIRDGGRLVAELTADMGQVTLARWPEQLFPITDGTGPTERTDVTGGGTFSTRYSVNGEVTGSAEILVTAAGFAEFVATSAYASSAEPGTAQLVFPSDDGTRVFAVVLDEAILAPGDVALGNLEAMAYLVEADGTQLALAGGVLHLDQAGTQEGAPIIGYVDANAPAYVLRCTDAYCGDTGTPRDDPPTDTSYCPAGQIPQSCVDVAALPSVLNPDSADIEGDVGIAGYDALLVLADSVSQGTLLVLVPTGTDLLTGFTLDLAPPPSGSGISWHGLVFAPYCQSGSYVTAGSITVAPRADAAANVAGTVTFTAENATRSLTFDLAVTPYDSGAPNCVADTRPCALDGTCTGGGPTQPPPETQQCGELATLPDVFTVEEAGMQQFADGEAPPGYDRALLLVDNTHLGLFAALVPAGTDLTASTTISLLPVDFEGYGVMPVAGYSRLDACEDFLGVDSGSLTLQWTTDAGSRLSGTANVVVSGVAHSFAFDVDVAAWSAAPNPDPAGTGGAVRP